MEFGLRNRGVIVTGGTRGIGFAIANAFAADAVLTRGMGETGDPNTPPEVRRMLCSDVLPALDAELAAAFTLQARASPRSSLRALPRGPGRRSFFR